MRTSRFTTLLAAGFLAVFLPLQGAAQQATYDSDSASIKQTVAAFIDAFNHHDSLAVANVFTEDADRITVRGERTHGRKEIAASYGALFTGRLKTSQRSATVKSVHLLSPEIALVDADYELSGMKSPAGEDLPPSKGLLIMAMIKQNGQWLINTYHEMELAPPAGK